MTYWSPSPPPPPQMPDKVSYSDIYTMICTVDTHFLKITPPPPIV